MGSNTNLKIFRIEGRDFVPVEHRFTPTEAAFVTYLFNNYGRVVFMQELYDAFWGGCASEYNVRTLVHTVENHSVQDLLDARHNGYIANPSYCVIHSPAE